MATEVRRDREYGRFKPAKSDRIKAKVRRPVEKRAERDGNDEAHLAAIRKLPCCVTLRTPCGEAHHLKQNTGERGAGMRSSDKWAVPICRSAHEAVESVGSRNETRWFAEHGIASPIDLAAALWAASPDISKMTSIVIAHRKSGA